MTITLPIDAETDRLARKLAEAMGKPLPTIVKEAIEAQARLAGLALAGQPRRKPNFERLMEISDRCATRPVLDDRTPDEIIGYDEFGVPK